jgi:hypothetical protein
MSNIALQRSPSDGLDLMHSNADLTTCTAIPKIPKIHTAFPHLKAVMKFGGRLSEEGFEKRHEKLW